MYSRFSRIRYSAFLLAPLLFLLSCEQRNRQVSEVPSPGRLERPTVILGELRPGPRLLSTRVVNPYAGDPAAMSEGHRLYNWYNCVGCHFNGGGGMGPPLMDDEWIYGSDPENVYDSIYRGRPNGMPAFGGRVPERQLWLIAAYVRSLNPNKPPETPGRPQSGAAHSGTGQGEGARPSGGGGNR